LSWTGKQNKWSGLSSKWSGFKNVGGLKANGKNKLKPKTELLEVALPEKEKKEKCLKEPKFTQIQIYQDREDSDSGKIDSEDYDSENK